MSPLRIGFESETSSLFAPRTTDALPPSPPVGRKTVGAVDWIVKLKLLLTPAGERMNIVDLPATASGSCALTCVEETRTSGTLTPLTERHDSASAVGSGISLVATLSVL